MKRQGWAGLGFCLAVLIGDRFGVPVHGQAPSREAPTKIESELTPVRVVGVSYPGLAHQAGIYGRVELEALVLHDGSVKEVRILSYSHPLLVSPAKDSLRQWRFAGCKADTGCSAPVSFAFVLSKDICQISECPSEVEIDLPNKVTIRSNTNRPVYVN
jgi:hypothetical protein